MIRKIKSKLSRPDFKMNTIKRLKSNRSSQDEMIGFVLIVVIVVVVALILMGLTLRKSPGDKNSREIENFLEASMLTTTDCAINFAPQYDSMQDLIKSCYENRNCEDGRNSCFVLNSSLSKMINNAFPMGEGSQYKEYNLIISYSTNNSMENTILILGKQNCSETGALKMIPAYPGEIVVELDLCYSE